MQNVAQKVQNTYAKASAPVPDPKTLSPRTIWGRIIIYLREHGYVAMHMACGDITDVSMAENVFVIKAEEQFLIDLLQHDDNKDILKQAFMSQGIKEYTIEKKDKKTDDVKQDIQKLKVLFGDKLIIKE